MIRVITDPIISAVFRGRFLKTILTTKKTRSQIDINMIVLIFRLNPKMADHLREMMAKIPSITSMIVSRNSKR